MLKLTQVHEFQYGNVIVTVPPSPPRNLRVVAKTDHSITITWEPPLENPGGRSISYNVYNPLTMDQDS